MVYIFETMSRERMSLIVLNFWWLPLFICLNTLPGKFANSSLSVCSFFKTLAAWVFPILNSLAITLQLNFFFFTSSKILIFLSNVRHRLLSFPGSRFFALIEAMLMSTSLLPPMIKNNNLFKTFYLKNSIKNRFDYQLKSN